KLVLRYHVQQWVTQNAPKLVTFGQDLSKPALAFGKGALSLLVEMTTIFILVLLLLLEGPRLRRGILSVLSPGQAEEVQTMASEVNRAVVGYMLGNFLTSLICGLVVFITLTATGVPFPVLWALWVALVDLLPMIGGARSEEHTSELQSLTNLVCRLLLEKKKQKHKAREHDEACSDLKHLAAG